MTIQERAKEWCDSIINRLDTSDLYRGYIQGAVEERSEFKEYLSNKVKAYKCRGEAFFDREITAIEKINNELFGGE